jgi:hypothetical protein
MSSAEATLVVLHCGAAYLVYSASTVVVQLEVVTAVQSALDSGSVSRLREL